jgi:hypothetical protein
LSKSNVRIGAINLLVPNTAMGRNPSFKDVQSVAQNSRNDI